MNIYLLKSIIEILALILLFIISEKKDERITLLEEEIKNRSIMIKENIKHTNIAPMLFNGFKEPSFKKKIKKEEERIKAVNSKLPKTFGKVK